MMSTYRIGDLCMRSIMVDVDFNSKLCRVLTRDSPVCSCQSEIGLGNSFFI